MLLATLDALQPLQHSHSFPLQGSAVNSNRTSWQSLVAFNCPVHIVKPVPRKTGSTPFQRSLQQLFNQDISREEQEEQERLKLPQTQPFVDIQRGIDAAKSLKSAEQRSIWTKEIMAGLVVSLATIPTSISYSTVIGIKPLIGIWSSAIVGFFSSLVGGSPGMFACILRYFAQFLTAISHRFDSWLSRCNCTPNGENLHAIWSRIHGSGVDDS